MNDSDKDHFLKTLAEMREVFGGSPLTALAQRGYWIALRGLSVEAFTSAAERVLSSLKFFPRPVELLELASGSRDQHCERAWFELLDALDAYSSHDEILIGDPVLAATIKSMGGLREIANMRTSDMHSFGRRRFDSTYQSLIGITGGPMVFQTSRKIPEDPKTELPMRLPKRKTIGASDTLAITPPGTSEIRNIAGTVMGELGQ